MPSGRVIFHMRPEARFSDGTPVTAHDVLFSHNLLLDQGLKSYADAVRKLIPGAEVIDDHTIKFTFAEGVSRFFQDDIANSLPEMPKGNCGNLNSLLIECLRSFLELFSEF